MKFFNIDLHISVIKDIKTIFENLGHTVDNFSLSDHNWVMNFPEFDSKIINKNNWINIDEKMCDLFFHQYKKMLDKYDGFIVTHTPVFARLYEKFNKPIIVIASTRYEFPYTFDKNKWQTFNNFINTNPNIILISNNRFDKKYCELFLKKDVLLIESLCEYTNTNYTGEIDEFIIFSKANIDKFIMNKNLLYKELLKKYSWEDLSKRKGIIHIPYNISTMSFFEQYYSNIPLFVPSKKLLIELYNSVTPSLTEISYAKVHNFLSTSLLGITDDPNQWKDVNIVQKWIDLADFYNLEYVQEIQNLYDINLLDDYDFFTISKNMKKNNEKRKIIIYNSWEKILNKICIKQ